MRSRPSSRSRSRGTDWQLEDRRPEARANLRVCLALLRIYRGLPLRASEVDAASIARPFWPLLRRQRRLLLAAVQDASAARGQTQHAFDPDDGHDEVQRWCAEGSARRGHLPQEAPASAILELVGQGLVRGDSRFRPLFDAVQCDLEARVLRSRLPLDRNVDLLAELLQLSPLESRFLALAAAADASSLGIAPFSVVAAPVRLAQGIRAALDAPGEHDVRSILRRSSVLMRSGLFDGDCLVQRRDMEDVLRLSRQGTLLVTAPARSARALAAVILKRLADPPRQEPLAWPHLEQRTALLQAALRRALASRQRGVNILLHGAPGTGKTRYAQQLVQGVGAEGFSVADTDADGDPAPRQVRLASLMLSQAFAPPGRSIVVLDEAEDVFQAEYNNPLGRVLGRRDESKAWINQLLEANAHPVIWISNRVDHLDPAYLRRFTYCLEFPETPRRVRREIVRRYLAPLGCAEAVLDRVAGEARVAPALVASAASFSRLAGVRGKQADDAVTLMLGDMVQAMGGEERPPLAQRSTRFDFRYLNPRGAVAPDAVAAALQRLGQGRVLLSGPPGTGKTQLAAEMAQRMGRELVVRTASDINAMWFGESERNVARLFRDSDPQGEVLLLDEADTLLASRDATGHRAEIAVTAEFLRQLEAFRGVFVCATNFGRQLDAALLRRFEFRLELLPLATTQREALFCETALGWDPAAPAPAPELAPQLRARLHRLDRLTPGDFANVVRRVGALQLALDPAGWVGELEAEHAAKPGARAAGIGFV